MTSRKDRPSVPGSDMLGKTRDGCHALKPVPLFIESTFAREQGIDPCARICRNLIEAHVAPIPYGEDFDQVVQVARSLGGAQCRAAIFVVNTLGAKDMLKRLDPIMGETPALFLRRGLMAGQSGLADFLVPDPDTAHTMQVLGKLTLRLTTIWHFGRNNLDALACNAAQALLRFLETNEFRYLEVAGSHWTRQSLGNQL